MKNGSSYVVLLLITSFACTGNIAINRQFDEALPVSPWTHQRFDDDPDKFSFALISDLNGGERPQIFEIAVEQLNMLRPEFVVSVGDLIDGGTKDTLQLKREWEDFDARAKRLQAPFYYVPGNHDLSNNVMVQYWNSRYGSPYYHFLYKNVLFLMLNSEDFASKRMEEIYKARKRSIEVLASDTPETVSKTDYFNMDERSYGSMDNDQLKFIQQTLEANKEVRWTFLLMHKPLWKRDDNGWNSLKDLLRDRDYTFINGHEHNYSRQTIDGKNHITLGTTGGGQNAGATMAFDHITWITVDSGEPVIAHIRLDGILNIDAAIPLGGDTLCFQASACQE